MKKLLSVFIALVLVFSMSSLAFATPSAGSTAGVNGSNTVPVSVTVAVATFSVTVPTAFPVDVAADGTVTVAANAAITNNSQSPVKITAATPSEVPGWTIVAYIQDDNKTAWPTTVAGTKNIGFKLNELTTNVGKTFDTPVGNTVIDAVINGGGATKVFTYNANIPPQLSALDGVTAMNVVFTIGWAD